MEPINLYDYEARAQGSLPHNHWEFIEAGAMDEFTTRRNRSAFEDLTLRPRFLRDITGRDLSTVCWGRKSVCRSLSARPAATSWPIPRGNWRRPGARARPIP